MDMLRRATSTYIPIFFRLYSFNEAEQICCTQKVKPYFSGPHAPEALAVWAPPQSRAYSKRAVPMAALEKGRTQSAPGTPFCERTTRDSARARKHFHLFFKRIQRVPQLTLPHPFPVPIPALGISDTTNRNGRFVCVIILQAPFYSNEK
jgi:hypothetical protein